MTTDKLNYENALQVVANLTERNNELRTELRAAMRDMGAAALLCLQHDGNGAAELLIHRWGPLDFQNGPSFISLALANTEGAKP